jgi:16S rRNA C967 or C1407 C5-methylase (RsmB/RsmF family)/NOL1/NOP2/fmu family ribosome biogenesis protein
LPAHLPSELLRSLCKLDHFDPDAFMAAHASGLYPVSVHMNPGKSIYSDGQWREMVSESPFEISSAVPWAPDAYYLSARPSFTFDPFFHAGNYYVQEASGMFLAHALRKITDGSQALKVLDLCAAPGGKSTLIQSLISPDSLLVSNEVIKTRVPVLYQNITKWGRANGMVSNNDPTHFKQLPGFFDLLVVDAPCSGSGLFRKDPEAATNWNPDLVRLCSQRQQRILADAWDCLKEDGYLIYCTCSYSKEENEDILDNIFKQHSCLSLSLSPDPRWNIVETQSDQAQAWGYRFYPDRISGEGFFLAVLQKKQPTNRATTLKSKDHSMRIHKTVEKQAREWIDQESFHFLHVGEAVHALPRPLVEDFHVLKNALYLKKAGIRMGKSAGNEWIPDHELSLADILKVDTASLEVEKQDAVRYLSGEPFGVGFPEKGWKILTFKNQRLGWVKLLEKRMNNYYPKSWRIRL